MFSLVFYLPSFILLFAGLMKLMAVWSHDIFVAPWLAVATSMGIALLELVMGTLLVARPHHHAVLVFSISLFCCFAVFSGWKLISGIDDCGCFGRFSTRPSISLSISLFAIFVLFEQANRWPKVSSNNIFIIPISRVAVAVFLLMSISFLVGQASHWIEGKKTFRTRFNRGI